MTRRTVAMQLAVTVLAFAAYLAFYAVLDGAGLDKQREEIYPYLRQIARYGGLVAAGVAGIWAIFLSFIDPEEYQLKLALVCITGVGLFFLL